MKTNGGLGNEDWNEAWLAQLRNQSEDGSGRSPRDLRPLVVHVAVIVATWSGFTRALDTLLEPDWLPLNLDDLISDTVGSTLNLQGNLDEARDETWSAVAGSSWVTDQVATTLDSVRTLRGRSIADIAAMMRAFSIVSRTQAHRSSRPCRST